MNEMKYKKESLRIDTKEFELPETVLVRDIENRVFQGIILQSLAKIDGISLMEGNFIDNILGREGLEGVRGIHVEQDSKHQCVGIRVEINICYGVPIPNKAEEIQSKIAEEVTRLTGLHVSSIHVVFKNIVEDVSAKKFSQLLTQPSGSPILVGPDVKEDYNDEF